MTRVVHSFPLHTPGVTVIEVAPGSRVVHVAAPGASASVWIECPADAGGAPESWTLMPVPTGMQIEDGWEHVGSGSTQGGLAWHVYRQDGPA